VLQASSYLFASVDIPDFGASTAGEIAFWAGNERFYGCTDAGTPGVWRLLSFD
jgi:hypothetical protein